MSATPFAATCAFCAGTATHRAFDETHVVQVTSCSRPVHVAMFREAITARNEYNRTHGEPRITLIEESVA